MDSAARYLIHNLSDLWLKAHIQHPICLIKNKVCDALEVGHTGVQEVNQPSWSCNDNLYATAQRAGLCVFGLPTIHTCVLDT